MVTALAWVIEKLGYNADDILNEDKEARLRIQKAVYLLKELGIPELERDFAKYEFSLYINGPYSPDLADAYYSLARKGDHVILYFAKKYKPPKDPRVYRIIEFVKKSDISTLELAATALDLWKMRVEANRRVDKDSLVELLLWAKPWATPELCEDAIKSIENLGLIRF